MDLLWVHSYFSTDLLWFSRCVCCAFSLALTTGSWQLYYDLSAGLLWVYYYFSTDLLGCSLCLCCAFGLVLPEHDPRGSWQLYCDLTMGLLCVYYGFSTISEWISWGVHYVFAVPLAWFCQNLTMGSWRPYYDLTMSLL